MPRSIKEWIGKTDDSVPPQYVKLRVFDRHKGYCHRSGLKIKATDRWETDHIKPLVAGGENRENNLAPILYEEHKKKTAEEVSENSIIKRKRAKHLGLKKKTKARFTKKYDKNTGEWRTYDNCRNVFVGTIED